MESAAESDENNLQKTVVISTRKVSIFTQYARVFHILLSRWIPSACRVFEEEDELIKELEELILPSNEDWRQGVYYRLVELQRECDAEAKRIETDHPSEMQKEESTDSTTWEWSSTGEQIYPLTVKRSQDESAASFTAVCGIAGSMTEACVQPGWRINDILLAAKVLQKVLPEPTYSDEAEMRRVFGLVYDVLRYKNILNRALEDVGFWCRNNSMKNRERVVWLLLYDMQGRKFARRGEIAAIEEREEIFKKAGLLDIERALLEAKTHLAASVSRLRIGGSALNLDELLPTHLRTIEGVTWGENGSIASGWVNTLKVPNKNEFHSEMSKLNLKHRENCGVAELDEKSYTFDPLCPKIINLHEKSRECLAVSDLVRDHRFVFLDRSMCLGAAALAEAIRAGRLCGPVVLTHSVAPRHTGYLAGLLADIEDAGRLLAFGAAERRCEYETYLNNLGVTLHQCRIYSEKYVSAPPSAELERATVVLAVPPCSCTGVRDIVDLAVARGGDTNLFESLTTSSAMTSEIEQPRALLADQLSTLKHALTRPNVQFLLYEAHTVLPSETSDMIRQVVDYANKMATEKYLRDHPPKKKVPPKEGKASKSAGLKSDQDVDEASVTISSDITVPNSDLFEVASIDDIYGENSSRMLDPGCFLAVIKRKEMMQFDSLFMIKVAESKGLFGDPNEQKVKAEQAPPPSTQQTTQTKRRESKRAKIEIERIMAPTHCSLLRSSVTAENQICPRECRYNRDRNSMNQTAGSLDVSDESMNSENLAKAWRRQRESVKRLSVPTRINSPRKKLHVVYPLPTEFYPNQFEAEVSSPRRFLRHEEMFSVVKNFLRAQPLRGHRPKSGEHIPSSTALGNAALARAIKRIPLENEDENNGEENFLFVQRRRGIGSRQNTSFSRKISKSHPSATGYVRLPSRHRLEAVAERLQEISRLISPRSQKSDPNDDV